MTRSSIAKGGSAKNERTVSRTPSRRFGSGCSCGVYKAGTGIAFRLIGWSETEEHPDECRREGGCENAENDSASDDEDEAEEVRLSIWLWNCKAMSQELSESLKFCRET